MNKKAIAINVLISIMISVLFLFMVGSAIKNLDTNKEEKELEVRCKTSIDNRARTAIGVNEDSDLSVLKATIKSSPVLCETIKKKLKGDDSKVLREISEKLARCWWMFGEGKYEEILHGTDVSFLPLLFDHAEMKNSCFDCYNLMIDSNNVDITPPDLTRYIYETSMLNFNMTYLEYIQTWNGPGKVVFLAPEGIKSENAYTISFAAKNKEEDNGVWKIVGAVGGAVVLGLVTGGTGWVALAGAATMSAIGVSGVRDLKAALMTERDVSTIYLTHLADGENFCGNGVVD